MSLPPRRNYSEQLTEDELNQRVATIEQLSGDQRLEAELQLASVAFGAGSAQADQVRNLLALSQLAQRRQQFGNDRGVQ